jgi:transcriptional regulator with XRE-family HTH domain/tetratricopeptide (TPR) repeat protein
MANISVGGEQMQEEDAVPRRGRPSRGRPPNELDPASSAAGRFGAELRQLRLDQGLTIRSFAKLIGFSPTRVSEVENGRGRLSHEFVEVCEHTLPAGGALLTLFELAVQEEAADRHAKLAARRAGPNPQAASTLPVPWREPGGAVRASGGATPSHGEAVTDRRQLLRTGSTVAGVMLSGRLFEMLGTEPLAMTRALGTSTVDREELEYFEQTVARFMVDYERSGPVALLVPALEHFHAVRRLVEQRQPTTYQRRLCRVGTQLASLLGIFAYEDEPRARSWFHASQRAAQEAGDGELWAWALANESLIPGYGGNPQEALDLLHKAQRVLGRRPTVVAAMVMARTARAEATAGHAYACEAAMAQAEKILAKTTPEAREQFSFADPQLAFYRTSCHLRLGQPGETQASGQRALRLYEATPHYMDPALVRFELASSYVQQREIEEACRVGRQALVLPVEHRTGPVVQRGHELRRALEPYRNLPAVRDFDELLACL